MNHTKEELAEGAKHRSMLLQVVASAKDIAECRQLSDRNYWTQIIHPELSTTLKYPGSFVRDSKSLVRLGRRAPLLGEHNKEVYQGELRLSQNELESLKGNKII